MSLKESCVSGQLRICPNMESAPHMSDKSQLRIWLTYSLLRNNPYVPCITVVITQVTITLPFLVNHHHVNA